MKLSFEQSRIAASLSVLSRDTLMGLESVDFRVKAMAIPGVSHVGHSFLDADELVELVPSADASVDLNAAMRLDADNNQSLIVVGKYAIVGGTAYDCDCSSPLDSDGEGSIAHISSRRGDSKQHAQYREALGLDQYGSPDLNADGVVNELVSTISVEARKDRSLMAFLSRKLQLNGKDCSWAAVIKFIQSAIEQEGPEHAIDYLADYVFGVPYWERMTSAQQAKLQTLADLLDSDSITKAWESAVEKGTLGNPYAVLLDVYEHSGIAYSLSGTGMNCRWDTSRGEAVWIPCELAMDNIQTIALRDLNIGHIQYFGALGSESDPLHVRISTDGIKFEETKYATFKEAIVALKALRPDMAKAIDEKMREVAQDYCKGIIDVYTSWCNGDNHGILCYVVDLESGEVLDDHTQEVWGFIGHENAEKELQDTMLYKAFQLANMH